MIQNWSGAYNFQVKICHHAEVGGGPGCELDGVPYWRNETPNTTHTLAIISPILHYLDHPGIAAHKQCWASIKLFQGL